MKLSLPLPLPDGPITFEDRARESKWRRGIFGADAPMDYLQDYHTVGPAKYTLKRFYTHGKVLAKKKQPCLERLKVVMVHQAIYKRRFWSKKTLVRLLQQFVLEVYLDMEEMVRMGETGFPDEVRHHVWFSNVAIQQWRRASPIFLVPPMRPVPKPTLLPKLAYIYEKMKESIDSGDVFVERDNNDEREFFQYWMKKVVDVEYLPSSWFTWHNDEFDELFEYPCYDEADLGNLKLDLVNDKISE